MARCLRWSLVLGLLLVSWSSVIAQEAPWQRVLKGEDAKKAEAWEKELADLQSPGKFAEALKPAEALATLRKERQGEGHWEAADAARIVRQLKQAAELPAESRERLAEALRKDAEGTRLKEQGHPREAEPHLRKALAIHEEVLGPKHPDTALSYNNLASNLNAQGRLREAETLHRKALAIREDVLGPKHPHTAASYNNLGINLDAQGRPREAETLLRKALAIQEEVLGPKHPDTANSYNNLAYCLHTQDRPREAEALQRQALALFEEMHGPKHRSTANSYNNLALNLHAQGRPREAEPLFRKALAIREDVLGPKHPDTANSYNNLAYSLHTQGRPREAETLLRKALAIKEEVLGPKHPDTALSYYNLGTNLHAQDRPREAETLHRKALAIREEVLGPKHPHTAASYSNLGTNLEAQGRPREAETLLRKALAIQEEVLGPKHPDTGTGYNNLAHNLHAQDRLREAETLHRKALALREEVLGPKHPHTADSYNNLAHNLNAQGRCREADTLFRRALAIREEVQGPKHPHTAQSYDNLAFNLDAQGRPCEAETLHRKALAIREEVQGPKHPHTAQSYTNLAYNLDFQRKYKSALLAWQAAAATYEVTRLRIASTGLDRAAAMENRPLLGLALARARLGQPDDAWHAAEQGLARGLLDDLSGVLANSNSPQERDRLRARATRLEQLDQALVPLLTAASLDDDGRARRDALAQERVRLRAEVDQEAAKRAEGEVTALPRLQERLPADVALVFWVDLPFPSHAADRGASHYACVVRRVGPPVWTRLPGRGPEKQWTDDDDNLPDRLREALSGRAPLAGELARALLAQRLTPLEPHLAATRDLPGVQRLIAVSAGEMAGVPLEALTDQYQISYAPSGTLYARAVANHRPLKDASLLALGDPAFVDRDRPTAPPTLPPHGLLLTQVLPGGNAHKAGLKADDVLLRYGDTDLKTLPELKVKEAGEAVAARAWRQGKPFDVRLDPGKLGVVVHREPAPLALKQRQESAELLASTRGEAWKRLPGTRREVTALATLFPKERTQILFGSDASEQRLDALAGKLKDYRILHLATHGKMDAASARHTALILADDKLPDAETQVRKGEKLYDGRLTVEAVSQWKLDADLVVLSACETGLGKKSGGDGYLGFTQALFQAGARSVILSLWKVDDSATALLMTRFYENLLGKRDGLKEPLGRAAALTEAKRWLRALRRSEVEALAVRLDKGELRGTVAAAKPVVTPANGKEDQPYAHPSYWSAFILLGDPD